MSSRTTFLQQLRGWKSSLSGQILLLFLGVWLAGGVGFGYFFAQHLEKSLRRNTEEVADLVLKNLQQRQQAMQLHTRWVADKPDIIQMIVQQDRPRLLRALLKIQASLELDSIQVVSPRRELLAQVQIGAAPQANDPYNQQFYRATGLGLEALSTLSRSRESSLLAASIAIKSERQIVAGLIVGEALDRDFLNTLRASQTQDLMVIEGDRVTASTVANFPQQYRLRSAPKFSTLTPQSVTLNGVPYIAKTVTLPSSLSTETKLVILTSAAAIEQAKRQLWIFTAMFCGLGVGIAFLIGQLVTGGLTHRIQQLIVATQQLADGDLRIRLPASGRDEVSQLAHNFNFMADQLTHRDGIIQAQVEQLQETLQTLKQTQAQLIHTEKMSSLGQMVAGIAHEINNPVGFIHTNLTYAETYTENLLRLIARYQQHYPDPVVEIEQEIQAIDLAFIETDLAKLYHSMNRGTERIRDIVLSLRNFSHLDESDIQVVDLQAELDSTLLILQHRLNQQADRAAITVEQDYDALPTVECYPRELNQVFLNILSNAIDALAQTAQPMIWVTAVMLGTDHVAIAIADNGCGMDDDHRAKIFDPFFTTKSIGSGTGLGLSVSYQIIVEQHRGQLVCHSSQATGTEFVITIPVRQMQR
jgi:two-component system, NtrC family, sensor kinase